MRKTLAIALMLQWNVFQCNAFLNYDIFSTPCDPRAHISLLHFAAANGQLNQAKLLVHSEKNINAVTNEGCTPLHYAIWYKHEPVVHFLLDHGAHINAKTHEGATPLDLAVFQGNAFIVNTLLDRGAPIDPNAIQIAEEQKITEIVALLKQVQNERLLQEKKISALMQQAIATSIFQNKD
jgi:FOG: Ankyrin repeat